MIKLTIRDYSRDEVYSKKFVCDDEPLYEFICFMQLLHESYCTIEFTTDTIFAYRELIAGKTITIYLNGTEYKLYWPTEHNTYWVLY